MSGRQKQPPANDDEDADFQLALRLSAELNGQQQSSPANFTHPQAAYDDDADFALALQLQFEDSKSPITNDSHAFGGTSGFQNDLPMGGMTDALGGNSNRGNQNATSYVQDSAGTTKFATATAFINFIKAARCRKCNEVYFQSSVNVSQFLEQWKSGRANLTSLLKCRKCSTNGCIGCTPAAFAKHSTANIKGKQVTWCCDAGRLLLIWLLLCGFDEHFTALKSKQATASRSNPPPESQSRHKRPRPAQGGPRGIGFGGSSSMLHPMGGTMPNGTGFGSEIGDVNSWVTGYPNRAGRFGANSNDMEGKIKALNTQQNEDQACVLYLEHIESLLPSLERGTSFDFEPPDAVADLLLESKLLAYCAELLRNDSVEDATKRKGLYQTLVHFLQTLGGHYATANRTIFAERPMRDDKMNLLKSSFNNNPGAITEKGLSLFVILRSLHSQSTMVLHSAKRNANEFRNNEGQDLLLVCRLISDLYQTLEANAGTSINAAANNQGAAVVDSVSDEAIFTTYYFAPKAKGLHQSMPGRTKRLITEISKLTTGLPSGIFVRHAESRMDVQKWLIIGPADTPYENGIFEFDVFCDGSFPNKPPLVQFKTTGGGMVGFNPNLYPDGKVCLSLLGTWQGEPWVPSESTLLQILISIQGLILCEEPWYNEPGREMNYQKGAGSPSDRYNAMIQQQTVVHAMLGWMNNTPPLWKDVVEQHFRENANKILQTAEKWAEAAPSPDQINRQMEGYGVLRMSRQPVDDSGGVLERLQAALKKYGATYVPKFKSKPDSKPQPGGRQGSSTSYYDFLNGAPPVPASYDYGSYNYGAPNPNASTAYPFGGHGQALGGGTTQPGIGSAPDLSTPAAATAYGRGGHVLGGTGAGRGGYNLHSSTGPGQVLGSSNPHTPAGNPWGAQAGSAPGANAQGRGGGYGSRGAPSTRGRGGRGGRNPYY